MSQAKILHNIEGGLDEMLIIAYIVGGSKKAPKSAFVIYGWSLSSCTYVIELKANNGKNKNPSWRCIQMLQMTNV